MNQQEMYEAKKLQGVQGESSNPFKVMVRADLQKQHEGMAKQLGRYSLVSMPGTEAPFEKSMADFCEKENIKRWFNAVEKNVTHWMDMDATFCKYPSMNCKRDHLFETNFLDINEWMKLYFCNQKINDLINNPNAFWIDLYGDACYVKRPVGEKYPHFNTMFNAIIALGDKPAHYSLTFRLMTRQAGGRKGMTALQYASYLKNMIDIRLTYLIKTGKIEKGSVIPVFQWIYRGYGKSDMITLGFSVNMGKVEDGNTFWEPLKNPEIVSGLPFDIVNHIRIKDGSKKTPYVKKEVTSSLANVPEMKKLQKKLDKANAEYALLVRRQAVKALYDVKIGNADIANLLHLSPYQVRGILAHTNNPDSFPKSFK